MPSCCPKRACMPRCGPNTNRPRAGKSLQRPRMPPSRREMCIRDSFYPDMAKNFQTTQGPVAFAMYGHLDLDVTGRGAAERPDCAFGDHLLFQPFPSLHRSPIPASSSSSLSTRDRSLRMANHKDKGLFLAFTMNGSQNSTLKCEST